MAQFSKTGVLTVPAAVQDPLIVAGAADEAQTLAAIGEVYRRTGYLLDPHTAVGYHVAHRFRHADEPMICLATAHPAKFPEAVRTALGRDVAEAHHPLLDALTTLPVRCVDLAADADLLKSTVVELNR